MSNTCRIGIGGPVGSGKTALIEAITPRLLELGQKVLIITNDTNDFIFQKNSFKSFAHMFGIFCSYDVVSNDQNFLPEFKKTRGYCLY